MLSPSDSRLAAKVEQAGSAFQAKTVARPFLAASAAIARLDEINVEELILSLLRIFFSLAQRLSFSLSLSPSRSRWSWK